MEFASTDIPLENAGMELVPALPQHSLQGRGSGRSIRLGIHLAVVDIL